MNHSLWDLTLYTRHRHAELVAECRTRRALARLPAQPALAAFRRALGLRLIAAGRVVAGADTLRESPRSMRLAVQIHAGGYGG